MDKVRRGHSRKRSPRTCGSKVCQWRKPSVKVGTLDWALRKGVRPVARKEILAQIEKYVDPFCIKNGEGFQLKHFDPGDTRGLKLEKAEATNLLRRGTEWLAEDQDMLYAQDRWSLLLVFQAMDAAGKDSTIKHVMSGVIHRAARFSRSNSRQARISTTTFSGVTSSACPREDGLESSTGPITRRSSLCACTMIS